MIVRRIREHWASHDWFAVAIDVLIVIVGVFLANLVTNWNDDRIERKESRDYRAKLLAELKYNERQYGQQISYYKQVRDHALAALDAFARPGEQSDLQLLVDAYQATQIDPTPAKRFVFDAIVSAGLLSRLGNEDIEKAASAYYLQMATREPMIVENLPYRDLLRQEMPYEIQHKIHSACGDRPVYFEREVVGFTLPEDCRPAIAPGRAKVAALQIRSVPKIDRSLTRYASSIDQKLSLFESGLQHTVRLKTLLQSEQP